MNENNGVLEFLESSMDDFIKYELPRFGIGNKEVYSDIVKSEDCKDFGLNPFLKYEADVKVKLGGYLFDKITKNYKMEYTINSEMPYLYLSNEFDDNPRARIDLSLHKINQEGNILWLNHDFSRKSLIAGIEIKLLNYKFPNDNIFECIYNDIDKLSELEVNKYLIIIVESDDNVKIEEHIDYIKLAKDKKIKIFTNSEKISEKIREIIII